MTSESRRAAALRVRALLEAARKIASAEHPLGQRARAELPALTGLSAEGVLYALQHHLEVDATDAEIEALCASVPEVPCAHVLLSANVFVAALRALALGLAASPTVFARASRREPLMLPLLAEASNGAFRIVTELVPRPGDHLFAYGDDTTLASLRAELAAGVVLHGHGFGFGVAVCEPAADARVEAPCSGELSLLPRGPVRSLTRYAELLARDVAVFDQRGCLSPRLVLVKGTDEDASALGRELGRALSALEARMPRGALSADEAADVALYRDTMAYAGELYFAGKGCVGVDLLGRVMLPPVGRHLHLVRTDEPLASLAGLSQHITTVSVEGSAELVELAARAFPRARQSRAGMMQRPPLDGPVDRRGAPEGERL